MIGVFSDAVAWMVVRRIPPFSTECVACHNVRQNQRSQGSKICVMLTKARTVPGKPSSASSRWKYVTLVFDFSTIVQLRRSQP